MRVEIPSGQAGLAYPPRAADARARHARLAARARVAFGGEFDESKHPRDAHGRFGEGDGTASSTPQDGLLAAMNDDAAHAVEGWEEAGHVSHDMKATGDKLLGLTGIAGGKPDVADLIGVTKNPTLEMAAQLKAGVAHDLAASMKSDTTSLYEAGQGMQFDHHVPEGFCTSHDYVVVSSPRDWGGGDGSSVIVAAADLTPLERERVDAGKPLSDPSDEQDPEWGSYTSDYPQDSVGFRCDTPEAQQQIRETAVSNLVSNWSGTSNDTAPQSLALQETVAKEFGLTGHAGWPTDEWTQHQTDGLILAHGDVYRDFARTQYDQTQAYLKGEGVTEMTLARGWAWTVDDPTPQWAQAAPAGNSVATVETRPLSSWSSDAGAAHQFAVRGLDLSAVTYQTVPVERIFATPLTGIGCLNEREFVVLGGKEQVVVARGKALTASAGVPGYDARTLNEDWLKTTTWDLPTKPGAFRPGELEKLAQLPAGEAMPADLRAHLAKPGPVHARARYAAARARVQAFGEFDESKHPRDAKGRFGEGGSGVTVKTPPDQEFLDRFHVSSIEELAARLGKGLPPGLQLTDLTATSEPSWTRGFTATFGGKGELTISPDRTNSLHLDVMDLPPESQGQGVAKEVLGNLVDYAQENGIDRISLVANIDVGSYAWAKFGFVPEQSEWDYAFRVRDPIQARLDAGVQIPAESRAIVDTALATKDSHAFWDIVDAPGTFPLLQGTRDATPGIDWSGRLEFKDEAAMARFHKYVGR